MKLKIKKNVLSRVLLFMFLLVLMINGCAHDDYKETNMENMIELTSWHFTSGVPNNLITIHYPNEKAKIEIIADDGYFLNNKESKEIISPETIISWAPGDITATKSKTFISVIITVNNNIEAYGIVLIYRQDNSSWLDAKAVVLKSVLIKNQTKGANIVSREYISSLLEELKK